MTREEKLQKLRKGFGLPENGSWDPEAFLLQLGLAIRHNSDVVKEAVESLTKSEIDKNEFAHKVEEITKIGDDLKAMTNLQKELVQAIKDRRVEKVEVTREVHIPPQNMKIAVDHRPMDNEERGFWQKLFESIKAPLDPLIQWFDDALKTIQTPEGAIAVKLTDKEGRGFYNAVLSAVTGGVTVSMANTESYLSQLVTGSSRTYKVASGTASSSGNNTIVSAVTGKLIKVYSYSLFIISTTAVTCIFQDGAGGTSITRVPLQSPASVTAGAAEAVATPDILFKTSATTLLNLNLSAAVTVHYNVRYWDNDAS